jgi:ubiquitin-protein ligase
MASAAIARLTHDWRELTQTPLNYISAAPLDEANMFIWHANIKSLEGKYAGRIIHLHLDLPPDYPDSAPQVKVPMEFAHPNVFGDSICLDMLKMYAQGAYKGWSRAYSVSGILIQLASFLFEEHHIPQTYGGGVPQTADPIRNIRTLESFACRQCAHTFRKPWPPLVSAMAAVGLSAFEVKSSNSLNAEDAQNSIFAREGAVDVIKSTNMAAEETW